MDSRTALKKLQGYKDFEGREIQYDGRYIKIDKVVAAPYDQPDFTDYFQDFLERNEEMASGDRRKYDIYFLMNVGTPSWSFIRLDEFLEKWGK